MKALQIGKGNRALTEEEALRIFDASMKALHKRKGNLPLVPLTLKMPTYLDESPSKQEGKFATESPAGRFPDEPQ